MKSISLFLFSGKGIRIFLPFFVFLGFFLVSLEVRAANEENRTVMDGPFSLSGAWGGALNVGPRSAEIQTINVRHEAGTTEGSLVVLPGDALNFSYTPSSPGAVLDDGIFDRDNLLGGWSASLNARNECSADPRVFSAGADQYSLVLCGARSNVTFSSSNSSIVNCSGMVCTAVATGNSRITANISGVQVKLWGNKSGEANWVELVSDSLPSAVLSWDVNVVAPPTVTFSMNGTNPIPYDTAATLSWTAENVVSSNPCIASGDWSGTKAATGNFLTGNLTARRDYTLRCTGPSGDTVERIVTVLVGSPTPSPQLTFSAGSTLIPYNTATTLSWNISNPAFATSCEARGDWSSPGVRPLSGSESTGNLTDDRTYVLECFGPGGSQAKQIVVRVIPPPSPPEFRTFSANPDHIFYDDSTEIAWEVRSAASCLAFSDAPTPLPDWNGNVPLSGSRTIPNLTRTTTFSLSCRNSAGDVVREDVLVRVEPQNLQPPNMVFFTADDVSLNYNEETTLRWKIERADWCEASGDWDWWTDTYFEDWYDTGNLPTSRDFTLHCENLAGWVERTVHISVDDPANPVSIVFTADPYVVEYGEGTQAEWLVQNAQWCYLDWWRGGVYQARVYNFSFSGSEWWGGLTQTETDVLTCGNSLGTASASVTITVNPGPPGPDPDPDPTPLPDPPLISLTRDSGYISYNTATTLRWSVVDADTCIASNDQGMFSWSGSKELLGSTTTGNLRSDTVFSLECTGLGGTTAESVTVRVGDASQEGPALSFWADSIALLSGESTRLRWVSTNATSCAASGDWSGNQVLQGPASGFDTGALTESKSYRLRCSSAAGAVVVTVNVFVDTPPLAPSLSFYADDVSVPVGGSTMLRWSAQNVRSCVATSNPASIVWSGSVPIAGGRNTGVLPVEQAYDYTIECTNGLPNGTVSLSTRVFAGSFVALGPEVNLFADATVVQIGSRPILHYSGNYADRCTLSIDGGMETLLPSLVGIVDESFAGPITAATNYTLRCYDGDGTMSSKSETIRVGKVLICSSSPLTINPGQTLQLSAWYADNDLATCDTVASLGGTDVTDSGATWITSWFVSGGSVVLDGAAGRIRGVNYGIGVVRADYLPQGALAPFSASASILVTRQITCHRCDDAVHTCSPSVHYSMDDDDSCSMFSEFSSPTSCRFACFKSRWQEVAP